MLRTLLMIGAVVGAVLALSRKCNGRIRPLGGLPRLGIFLTGPAEGAVAAVVKLFKDEMQCLGWVEGRDIVYDLHPADRPLRDKEEMRAHARKLIDREPDLRPDIIWLVNTDNALAVADAQQQVQPQIAVVGSSISDEVVARGLLKHPCVLNMSGKLGPMRLQLVKELLGEAKPLTVAVLYTRSSEEEVDLIKAAAPNLDVTVLPVEFSDYANVDGPFAQLADKQVHAVLTTHDQFFRNTADQIIRLATERRLPLIGYRESFARLGAVMAFGTSLQKQIRMSAELVAAVLTGARAENKEPQDRELWINRAAAKKLGLPIPDSLFDKPGVNVTIIQ